MGAFKDKTGKTRVGTVLQSIGGFFSGIFKKKTTTTTPQGATPPINGNANTTDTANKSVLGGALASLGVALGNTALTWIGQQLPDPNATGLTPEQQAQIEADNKAQAQSTGNGVLVIIVGAILAFVLYFFIKRKK